jgi:hypothetical protein
MRPKSTSFPVLLSVMAVLGSISGASWAFSPVDTPSATATPAEAAADSESPVPSSTLVRLEDILSSVAPQPIFLTCTANQPCGSGVCPSSVACAGQSNCSSGGDGGGWVECDGNRKYCGPVCATFCCTLSAWQACDRYCREDVGASYGYCDHSCCACGW